MPDSGTRQRLQLALREALRGRDTIAVSALRSALAAIDNAGAVPVARTPAAGMGSPHFADAAAGLGAGEAARRSLTEAQVEEIVAREVAERQSAAGDYDQAGQADQADRLRREARVLISCLDAGAACPGNLMAGVWWQACRLTAHMPVRAVTMSHPLVPGTAGAACR